MKFYNAGKSKKIVDIMLSHLLEKLNHRLLRQNTELSCTDGETVSYQKDIRCHLIGCACQRMSYIRVSDELRCVYFETPKAATRSLRKLIKPLSSQLRYNFYQFYGTPFEAAEKFKDYYKFTFIRCPARRMLSNYKMFFLAKSRRKNKEIEILFQRSREEVDFEEFLDLARKYRNHHWEQYCRYLPIKRNSAGGWNIQLEKVGRVESFQNDWSEINEKLGLSKEGEYPYLNDTSKINFNHCFNHREKELLVELFPDDIDLLRSIDVNYSLP